MEGLDDVVFVLFVILEVALMILDSNFSFRKLLVSENLVTIDAVNEMRPPVQGKSLVGVLDDLRFVGQRREL